MGAVYGAIGAMFLFALYKALKIKWPENYSDMRSVVDSASQKNGLVYLMMRIIPVYLVAIVVASTSGPSDLNVNLGLVVFGVLHLVLTNFRGSVISNLRRSTDRSRFGHITFHIGTSLLLIAVVAIAAMSWKIFIPVLPDGDELVQAFWTALILWVVVSFIQEVTRYQTGDTEGFDRAQKDLGSELSVLIDEEANAKNVYPNYIQSIILAECIQRPKWVRKMENIKGKFIGPGSYGVAQMSADEPITDAQSIELLCEKFAGYYPARSQYGGVLQQLMLARYEEHNRDPVFVKMAFGIFQRLEPSVRQRTLAAAADGRGLIEILDIKRDRESWIVLASCTNNDRTLIKTTTRGDHVVDRLSQVSVNRTSASRVHFSLEMPIQINQLRLEFDSADEPFDPDSVLVLDLSDPWVIS